MSPEADKKSSATRYLDTFRSESFNPGHWTDIVERDGYFTPPYFVLHPAAEAFVKDCYAAGFIRGDWTSFAQTEEGRRLRTDPEAIARASKEQLFLVLTAIVRGDRFSPGTLANAFETGLIVRVLERLEQLEASA